MKRSRKSNRVSWAPGLNLCQVRLFLSEDCPSKISTQAPEHLQKNRRWMLQNLNGRECNDLPPGFGGKNCLNPLKEAFNHIPRIEWRCPPKFVISHHWQVAAGEESQQVEIQKVREMRVLEAVYPRPSAIPPSSSVSLDVEDKHYDDSLTPVIPLIPIEEEEAAADTSFDLSPPLKTPTNSLPPVLTQAQLSSRTPDSSKCNIPPLELPASEKPPERMVPDSDADLMTAASAALTALMKSKEQGSLIDTDLLVKILSDPKMIQKLINDNKEPDNKASAPMLTSDPLTGLIPPSFPKPGKVLAQMPANGNLRHLPTEVRPLSNAVMRSLALSGPKPSMQLAPMTARGSLHQLLGEVQPVVTSIPPQPVTVPVSESKRVASSISMPRPESNNVPAPRPAVGNLFTIPNQVQTRPTIVTTQPKAAPNYFLPMRPDPRPSLVRLASGMMPSQPIGVPQTSMAPMKTKSVKDVNYIKNLIREHGLDKQEMQDRSMSHNGNHHNPNQNLQLAQNIKLGEVKPKFQKTCLYFKTSKGCRNGFDCPYQHDFSFQMQTGSTLEAPGAKRIKLSGEITGRT